MRLAVIPSARMALWGSEGTAIEVPVAGHSVRHVLRLDSVKGQVIELKCNNPDDVKNKSAPHEHGQHFVSWAGYDIKSYDICRATLSSATDLRAQFREIVTPMSMSLSKNPDPVLADLRDIPALLERIKLSWRGIYHSPNQKSAITFVDKLKRSMAFSAKGHIVSSAS